MLVTTHYMDEAEYCDRISIMVDGRIGAMGTPAELKRVLAALLRGQDVVQVARLRQGKNDVALLEGQRVLASYVGMDEALAQALDVPADETVPAKGAPAVEHLRAFLRAQLSAIEPPWMVDLSDGIETDGQGTGS